MKTRDFLREECANVREGKHEHRKGSKTVASVFCDGEAVYSYGHHYPLYFMIEHPQTGKRFSVRNITWYSNTTAKHISYAGRADIDVELRGREMTLKDVMMSLTDELTPLEIEMSLMKRKNTQKYARMEARARAIKNSISLLVNKIAE